MPKCINYTLTVADFVYNKRKYTKMASHFTPFSCAKNNNVVQSTAVTEQQNVVIDELSLAQHIWYVAQESFTMVTYRNATNNI